MESLLFSENEAARTRRILCPAPRLVKAKRRSEPYEKVGAQAKEMQKKKVDKWRICG
jgi:hypothetical protein